MEIDEMMLQGICLRKLLEKKMTPLMQEYGLRPVELDILFFLDMQKDVDTARELIRIRHLSKAHISKSVESQEKRIYHTDGGRRGSQTDAYSVHRQSEGSRSQGSQRLSAMPGDRDERHNRGGAQPAGGCSA